MPTFATKQQQHEQKSTNLARSNRSAASASHQAFYPARFQPTLAVNARDDIYEQEADRFSEHVMRMPEPLLQRACACGGGCPECQTERPIREPQRIQTKPLASSDAVQTGAPPIVHDVLASPGQLLEPAARAFFEPRLGLDLSGVTVHTDSRAGDSAEAVQARAYTVGHDIVFGADQYAPQSESGRRLIAHELTHVLQQEAAQPRLQRQPKSKPPAAAPPAPPAGGNILYIGLNNFPLEIAALKKLYKGKQVDITSVTLAKDTAHTVSGDKTFDLTSDAGVDAFAASLGLDKARAASAAKLIKANSLTNDRDDMAHVMAVYALTEADGQDRMSRVVLSGHSFGLDIMDDPLQNHIAFSYLVDLAGIFPKAAAQTRHLLVSACYAGAEDNVRDIFRKAFPSLITFSGYTDQCPTNAGGARAVRDWAKTTDPDPTDLAKPPEGRSTWASGFYQGVESSSPADTMKSLRDDEPKFLEYFSGVKVDADAHRGWLTTYYGQARNADLRVSSIKGADHDYAHVHAEQAVRLRLWAQFVSQFWKDNETKIRAGYGKASVPNFGKMTRKEALKAIDKFPAAAQGTDADKAEAQRLLEGLKNLDTTVLPG
jgi:hypothetical protein